MDLGGHGSQTGETGTGGTDDGEQRRGAGFGVSGRGTGFSGGQVVGCNYGGDIWGGPLGGPVGDSSPPPSPTRVFSPRPGAFSPPSSPPVPAAVKVTGGRTPRCCSGDEGTSPKGDLRGARSPQGGTYRGRRGRAVPERGRYRAEPSGAPALAATAQRHVRRGGAAPPGAVEPGTGTGNRAPHQGTATGTASRPPATGTVKKAPGKEIRN